MPNRRLPRPLWFVGFAGLVLAVGVPLGLGLVAVFGPGNEPRGEPGPSTEALFTWSAADGPLPVLVDATAGAGLAAIETGDGPPASGGAALDDLDRDGDLDLVVAATDLHVLLNDGTGRFVAAPGSPSVEVTSAASVGTADLDGDGLVELVVGQSDAADLVIWGGWTADGPDLSSARVTELGPAGFTSGVLAADLTGDAVIDLVRLGYGDRDAAPDQVLVQGPVGSFSAVDLPHPDRFSLAAEVADIDGDDLADIWITRDIGWASGGDSVLSRTGAADGEWTDRAEELGADLRIDGMGVTLADLDADGRLDAYLSDIGANDVLLGRADGFVAGDGGGALRVRRPGASATEVSSSWASGATDLNLDGETDLVVANGGFGERSARNKIAGTTIADDDPPAVFLGLGDGRFADVWTDLGLRWRGNARGLTIGDVDGDGDDDFVVVTVGDGVRLYRNDTSGRSTSIRPSPRCALAGAVAVADGRPHLVKRHTFLGAHAPWLVLGGTPEVEVDGRTASRSLAPGRTLLTVTC